MSAKVLSNPHHDHPGLIEELESIPYRHSPGFLGRFDYLQIRARSFSDLGAKLLDMDLIEVYRQVLILAQLSPHNQKFNTVFIQRYRPDSEVLEHRDPLNNLGHTIIGLYGSNWRTQLRIKRPTGCIPSYHLYNQRPGQVYILPCTIDGVQGPWHSVRWLEGMGTRYAIILNTIS